MKPDQPTEAPLGKRSIRSDVFANLVSIDGLLTRLLRSAEAAIEDMMREWRPIALSSDTVEGGGLLTLEPRVGTYGSTTPQLGPQGYFTLVDGDRT